MIHPLGHTDFSLPHGKKVKMGPLKCRVEGRNPSCSSLTGTEYIKLKLS